MSFQELSQLTGQPLRAVQFDLAGEDVELLKTMPEFKDFNPATETLTMLKPIYGLKDAPRAWRRKLDQVLRSFGAVPLYADNQVYVRHRRDQHGKTQDPPTLELILSTHVDDLKGAATKEIADKLLKHIESKVGKCTQEYRNFVHTGIEHEQSDEGIYCHQAKYVEQLRPIDSSVWSGLSPDAAAPEELVSMYMSFCLLYTSPSPRD